MNELLQPRWSEIWLRGNDAFSFSQGQFSQEVGSELRHTLLLAPDGTVISGGQIDLVGENVRFIVPTVMTDTSLARLRRFLLRVDVAIDVRDEVEGPFGSAAQIVAAQWPSEHEWALGLAPHSYGRWVVDGSVSFSKGCFTGQELVGRADARGATMPWRFVGGTCGSLESVHTSLRAVGPDGPQGVTSWYRDNSLMYWRGFAHRTWTNDDVDAHVQFMA